jgi:hypothetical protein
LRRENKERGSVVKKAVFIPLVGALLLGMAAQEEAYRHPKEATEWIVSYHYNANESALPRVLLIGDSICNQYNEYVHGELTGTAYVSFFATSKCCTDRTYLDALRFVLNESDYAVIHFNNGLHSLDTPPDEWEKGLRGAFKLIREMKPTAKVVWCSSTPVKDAADTEKVVVLNKIGEKVAEEFGAPTDDLFELMNPLDRAKYWQDKFHFNDDAKKMQAKQVAATVRTALGK